MLDFTWAVAGPIATKMLAMHGATVIKVESNLRLDGTRIAPPFRPKIGRNRSAYYTDLNNTKYSVTLNLNHPEAKGVIHRLVPWADVVIENFSPGIMERWGLGYEDLVKLNPDVIMLSSTMQGREGPHAAHVGLGPTLGGLVGLNHFTGWPDREPVGITSPYTDVIGPWFAGVAVMAALEQRDRTGQGQHVDLSQYEAAIHMLAPAFLDYAANGRVQTRVGNRSSYWAPHGAYRCQSEDRWVALAVTSDGEWERFTKAIGDPAWARDPRFRSNASRLHHADGLDPMVEAWTVSREAEAVARLLQAAGVPAGVVATARELHADPTLKAMGQFVQVDHPEIGPHAHTHPSFWLESTPAQFRPAARIGEHNEWVYKELAGLPDEVYTRLQKAGVFQ